MISPLWIELTYESKKNIVIQVYFVCLEAFWVENYFWELKLNKYE